MTSQPRSFREMTTPQLNHEELLEHAARRHGWQQLTHVERERAAQLILAADHPELGILALDNHAKARELGWSVGQSQRLVRSLKAARLIDVSRKWETLPSGRKRELGPASWMYTYTDELLPSQIPKRRTKRTEPRLRSLERHESVLTNTVGRLATRVAALEADIGRLQAAGSTGG